MKLLLITIVLLALAFAGIAIKIWAKKDGEFDGTCAGSNVKMKEKGITCGCGNEGGCKSNLDNLESTIQVKKVS
ncbi:MAG: membrane or secreted protein [Flavobacteriaceae bacterium]|nr:membrane or secreted protein [Flavobacteriaceae bacterium]